MVWSDKEQQYFKKHSDICSKLKLDVKLLNEAWHSFQVISKNFTLEGDCLHWIGCAIYATTWKSASTTGHVQMNFIDLTGLLRQCNLSLAQFFCNIKKWSDMAKMPEDFNKKVDHVENAAAVVYNVFKEYQQLFCKIFKMPEFDSEQARLQLMKLKKPKHVPCTPLKIFEFCWTLFVIMKGEEANYGIDLVTSCHLLIAVCDWAFKNAYLSSRKDLLNPEFKGLPADWQESNFVVPEREPCIINYLCSNEIMITDIKYIKHYPFKQFIRGLFDKNILFGKEADQNDVFDSSVFDRNYKSLIDLYEQQFSRKGDFNERIFLADYQRKLVDRDNSNSTHEAGTSICESPRDAIPVTPHPRKFLGPKDTSGDAATPFATATENTSKLKMLLNGRSAGPSEELLEMFKSCSKDPTEKVESIVAELGDRFVKAYAPEPTDSILKRLETAKTLFYKLVESILRNEKAMRSDDISFIVDKDVFYKCTFACSLEIVIYAYGSSKVFPWILKALDFQAYDFVKIIELIIRLQDQFSRDIVKHLNVIEAIMISSIVWKSDSALWTAIENSGQEIPKFEETALPGHLQSELKRSPDTKPQSPGPSATERFQSPINSSSVVNRQLFPNVQSGQSLLMINYQGMKVIPLVNNETKQSLLQSAQLQTTQQPTTQQQATPKGESVTPGRPKRTGSLAIIFRKFYHLAGVRLEKLLTKLDVTNTEIKQKIWTIFEESVRKNNCELMKDRDLDQLLMCAIYMVGKLSNTDKYKFTDIMKMYRAQPQATSEVYRNVLISNKRTEIVDGNTVEHPAKRGDLIEFYNTVVIGTLKEFAEKFVDKGNKSNADVLLSPLPCPNKQLMSPGRVYNNIIIKAYESPKLGFGGSKTYNYYFSRSPSKDLKDINKAIKGNGVTGKRLLVEGDVDIPSSKRIANRKVQSLIEERRNQNSE